MKTLEDYVINIPDFPKEGIIFRDITTLIQDPEGLKLAIDMLIDALKDIEFDYLVAAEARGFIFASPIAYALDKGVVLARKKGKLPYRTIQVSYDLEYGSETIEMHEDALKPGDKVVLIDDLLATGGTLSAIARLVETTGATVAGVACVINLPALGGEKLLEKYGVTTLVSFDGE